MTRGASVASIAATIACALVGCDLRPPFVVLTVEDPHGLAVHATDLRVGADVGVGRLHPLDGREFPLTLALTSDDGVTGTVWVEASRGEGVVARGQASVHFEKGRPGGATVLLGKACDTDASCDDGAFCDGEERCASGICESGAPPCPSSAVACVQLACIEEARACGIVVSSELDDRNPCTVDACEQDAIVHIKSPEGVDCPPAAGGFGYCSSGQCVPSSCGDAFVDPNHEECDPGSATSYCIDCRVELERASIGPDGGKLSYPSYEASISDDGRRIAFLNGTPGVKPTLFVRDRSTDETILVESASARTIGHCAITGDGARIILSAPIGGLDNTHQLLSSDLETGRLEEIGTNLVIDSSEFMMSAGGDVILTYVGDCLVVIDRAQGSPTPIPSGCDGSLEDLSRDGRFVLFLSFSAPAYYRYDRMTDELRSVVDTPGFDPFRGRYAGVASISDDGRYVAFASDDGDLVPGDLLGHADVFVRDLDLGSMARISVTSTGAEANGDSHDPEISADGRFVAFLSDASNLVPGDENRRTDLFVWSRETGRIVRIGAVNGVEPDSFASDPKLTPDGAFSIFSSPSESLVPGDTNLATDIFVARTGAGWDSR